MILDMERQYQDHLASSVRSSPHASCVIFLLDWGAKPITSNKARWPSGLRRHVKVSRLIQYPWSEGRGFESHSCQAHSEEFARFLFFSLTFCVFFFLWGKFGTKQDI